MKVSYNWLSEHIALDITADELAVKLAALGFEVPTIEKKGPQFKGVVTAKVLEVTKHPNADRLRLCVVDDGATKLSIVCGAPNVAVGLTVPLARVGATLPGGKTLTPAKIRGVESQGMLCSGAELGLASDAAGIMVLPESTPIGKDFAELLGPGDAVLEVEITPNRPDCLSHRGLARELSAYLGKPLKTPAAPALDEDASVSCPPVSIDAQDACPLYTGRLITGVKVAPSPGWLAAKLEAVGLRPINNVVDVTNYILMDIGQPLHVFDAAKLAGPEIKVRFANNGEKIKALDGKDYTLSGDSLVIADKDKAVAIAGVMGGEETGATEKTTTVLLEAAYFAPAAIRKSGQKLRLKSDSSYRFERGVDPGAVEEASRRAAALIAQLGGKDAKVSAVRKAGEAPMAPKPIEFTAQRINEILGTAFDEKQIKGAIGAIGKLDTAGDKLRFSPPTSRGDLETVWDLAEEAARLLGYDQVPSKAAPVAPKPARLTPYEALAERARDRMAALGLLEAYNYDFVSEKTLTRAGLSADGLPRLANPLSDDWTILRPTLLPGLLENAARNLNRGASSVRLFEVGTQYKTSGKEVEERRHAAGLLLGPGADRFWQAARTPDADFYDAKGLVEELLAGVPGLSWTPLKDSKSKTTGDSFFHPAAALRVDSPKGPLGVVGLLHPTLARAWELDRQPVALFDLDLDALVELESPRAKFSPYSQFPASRRDLSLIVDRSTAFAALEAAARKGAGETLQAVELVDVFAGKGIPEGKHSLLLRLTFGRLDRTLLDSEVAGAVEGALRELKALGAELRA